MTRRIFVKQKSMIPGLIAIIKIVIGFPIGLIHAEILAFGKVMRLLLIESFSKRLYLVRYWLVKQLLNSNPGIMDYILVFYFMEMRESKINYYLITFVFATSQFSEEVILT